MADRISTTMLQNDSVTSDKLRDDASTDGNRAVTTNHIRDLAISESKLASGAVTQLKIGSSAVGHSQSKFIVKENNVITSTSGDVIVASISLNPGTYYMQALGPLGSGGAQTWTITTSGGAATFSPSVATYNTSDYIYSIVTVTSATQLRVMSNASGSRRGYLFVIGMEN